MGANNCTVFTIGTSLASTHCTAASRQIPDKSSTDCGLEYSGRAENQSHNKKCLTQWAWTSLTAPRSAAAPASHFSSNHEDVSNIYKRGCKYVEGQTLGCRGRRNDVSGWRNCAPPAEPHQHVHFGREVTQKQWPLFTGNPLDGSPSDLEIDFLIKL